MSATDLDAFLRQFNVSQADFHSTGYAWADLQAINAHYEGRRESLALLARQVAETCARLDGVHSVRSRVKDADHLIEKLVRKKAKAVREGADRPLSTRETYQEHVTDLIGVRIIHLFKEDWQTIHDQIMSTWELVPYTKPTAFYRKGDVTTAFSEKGLETREHEYGYRSVHYDLVTSLTKGLSRVELQVRTIFEEGWSEIDHLIRYPYNVDHKVLAPFLVIFNRLAGQADDMGTFVKALKKESEDVEQDFVLALTELQRAVSQLKIAKGERDALQKQLDATKHAYESKLGLAKVLAYNQPVLGDSVYGLQSAEGLFPIEDAPKTKLVRTGYGLMGGGGLMGDQDKDDEKDDDGESK